MCREGWWQTYAPDHPSAPKNRRYEANYPAGRQMRFFWTVNLHVERTTRVYASLLGRTVTKFSSLISRDFCLACAGWGSATREGRIHSDRISDPRFSQGLGCDRCRTSQLWRWHTALCQTLKLIICASSARGPWMALRDPPPPPLENTFEGTIKHFLMPQSCFTGIHYALP